MDLYVICTIMLFLQASVFVYYLVMEVALLSDGTLMKKNSIGTTREVLLHILTEVYIRRYIKLSLPLVFSSVIYHFHCPRSTFYICVVARFGIP